MKWRAAAACVALALAAAGAAEPLPPDSAYQLQAALVTQSGAAAQLDLYRGQPVLVAMFYGSCPAACPMLITGIQTYEGHLEGPARARLRVLLVSFDAARDTPAALSALARLHRADPTRWTFAAAAEPGARKIAALLGVQYRRQPDGGFDHSLLITLLDGDGRILASTSKVVGDDAFLARLRAATTQPVPHGSDR
ncbi:MAG: SCO family protein [Nevskia sp.]|nr:SCO family protein [Nevskia sp.]